MIYKTLKKVSDVCQLFIPDDTHTVAGVTITNNGDGSLTIDGTGTGSGNYTNFTTLGKNNMPYKISDKLFISAYIISGTCSFLFAGFSQSGNPSITLENPAEGTYYSGNISKQDKYESGDALGFFVGNNTFNNFRVKFNIINLTEMYGAGNEPTTVEEFRTKFPNELYDYKPYCFVKSYKTLLKATDDTIITSYKKSLICTTKNLFDISKLQAYTPETLPQGTAGVYNGNIIARARSGDSSCVSGKTLKELCPDLVVGETYALSFKTTSEENRIFLGGANRYWANNNASEVTEAMLNSTVYFYANYPELTVATISNFQIELGSTATEYHPYGYL